MRLTQAASSLDSRCGLGRPTGHWSHVLSVSDHLPRAAFVLFWMGLLAMPAAAVMPSPAGSIPPEVSQAFDARLFDLRYADPLPILDR